MTIKSKRELRKKQTAEIFTPSWLVNEILDKLNEYGKESWDEGNTFLDPACGNGNILVEVLKRKLSLHHDSTEALKSIYGTDIMMDNIVECRTRLLKVLMKAGFNLNLNELEPIVIKNIVCTPLDKYPNGSLDYNFEFNGDENDDGEARWFNGNL